MVRRNQVVKEARSWKATPYKHMGRSKGLECDCVGLIIGVGQNLDLLPFTSIKNYPSSPDGYSLRAECEKNLRLATGGEQPGNIVLFWMTNPEYPTHLGILSELPGRCGIIHASRKYGKVIEHTYDSLMRIHSLAAYTYPEIED